MVDPVYCCFAFFGYAEDFRSLDRWPSENCSDPNVLSVSCDDFYNHIHFTSLSKNESVLIPVTLGVFHGPILSSLFFVCVSKLLIFPNLSADEFSFLLTMLTVVLTICKIL